MSKLFVVSDTHFFDYQIIEQGKVRHGLYRSIDEMHADICSNWKSIVSPEDTVIHLGDVAKQHLRETEKILGELPGKKRLILGNHDDAVFWAKSTVFESISSWEKLAEYSVVLSHYPLQRYAYHSYGPEYLNIHGHNHGTVGYDRFDNSIDVSLENTGFKPILITDAILKYRRSA